MITRIGIAADPAELELAIVTRHVVAACALLYVSTAQRTYTNFLITHPFFKLSVELSITRREKATMIDSATIIANILSAITGELNLVKFFTSHKQLATRSWTPTHLWIPLK